MYTILMKDDKSLVATHRETIYQGENLVDKVQFLLPETHDGLSLADYKVVLKYIDQGNQFNYEVLARDVELYKGKLSYILPVTTNLTRFAGNIVFRLSVVPADSTDIVSQEIMKSGKHVFTVLPDAQTGYPLNTAEKMIALENQIASVANNMSNDIKLDKETNEIYLVANGTKIGTAIALDDLGDALADETEAGLIRVITEGELDTDEPETEETVSYSLYVNHETDELCLKVNGQLVSTVLTSDIGESIVDSTDEGLNEVII